MNILAIGDVVGSTGCEFLRSRPPTLKKLKGIDLVIANGENSADGNGILPASADHLFDSGVDVITTGNHTFRRKEIYEYLDRRENIIRPVNYPEGTPGRGVCIYDMGRIQVAVVNLMGTVFMENLSVPFYKLDEIVKAPDLPRIVLGDFHADATWEKRALAFYADGRGSGIYGTLTHVQLVDELLMPKQTAHIFGVH